MGLTTFTKYKDEIKAAAEVSAKASGRENGNIEDQIRTANDLLRGLKILKKDAEATALETELNSIISEFAKSILRTENSIATAKEDKRENAYSVLVNFLLSFASRTGNRERLNIFTTNYDRLIEVGAELAGVHLMDRFVGTMMPVFRSSRLNLDIHYNPPGIRGEPRYLEGVARLTKLHGSVDWIQNGSEIRRVGTVEYISPDRIEVQLDIESPDSVALNTGMPRSFPRINGYLMIPVDLGFVVGQVSWITIQRSPYPKRSGFQDFGLIDLPFPLRKMELQPVGTLVATEDGYKFKRGLETFPSVGDIVILLMEDQLRSIIESGDNRRVYIGNSPLVGNAKVMIDPDRLFGRHLAVLGNTGSGKSCSVAGLIRWSLESAREKLVDSAKTVNSRFIVLDPNGEYSKAFADKQEANIFMVNVENGDGKKQLEVPLWFWNTDEWCGFTKASPKTHRTTIVHAFEACEKWNRV